MKWQWQRPTLHRPPGEEAQAAGWSAAEEEAAWDVTSRDPNRRIGVHRSEHERWEAWQNAFARCEEAEIACEKAIRRFVTARAEWEASGV